MKTTPDAVPGTTPYAAHASTPVPPSRKWRWSANVLLIGTSQSGKSTLINRFRQLAVGPLPLPDPAQVGKGTTSCTRDPFVYEYDIPMTDFILLDSQNKTMIQVPEDEGSIFDHGFWRRKDVLVSRRNVKADLARIRLIDTPGLDDSDSERNATNITKVLRLLNDKSNSDDLDQRHISAVVFVIKGTVAFNASLQEWYHYYQRCMPNLFGSVAVVNTNIGVRDWKSEYARKAIDLVSRGTTEISSRDRKMKERREAWAKIFGNDPRHFFIDNKPKPGFEDYMSANTVYDILVYLRSQGRLPIENVRLSKFSSMISIDSKLAYQMRDVCKIWEKEREHLVLSLSTAQQSLAQHEKNLEIWTTEIEELDGKLKGLDTDLQYDLRTHHPTIEVSIPSMIWKFAIFSGYEGTHPVTEDVYPYEVSAPDTECTRWKSRSMVNPITKTWKGEWITNWTKMPDYSIRTYTTNKTFHATEIASTRKKIFEKEGEVINTQGIVANEKELISKSGSSAKDNPRVLELAKFIAHWQKHMRHLKEEDVSLQEGFSSSAIQRYTKGVDKIEYSDVSEFIAYAEPGLKSAVDIAVVQLIESSV